MPLENMGRLSHKTGERMTEPLLLQIEGAIATITFNRPERRNAITFDMWNHLQRLLVDVQENPQVRVIVLRGAGQMARNIAALAPVVHRVHKEILQTVLDNPALEGLTPAQRTLAVSPFDTEDFQEGWRAFLEKRMPRFRGY